MAENPRLRRWEDALHNALVEVDIALEDRYRDVWPIRPNRPPDGETANPQYSGLFSVTASFTAGYGSALGRGYVIDVAISTLADIGDARRAEILEQAVELLRESIKAHFPERDLRIDRDGGVYKLHGDLSL